MGKILWRRKWQPAPVSLPEKSHGQRSLEGYSPWGCKGVGHNFVTKQQQFSSVQSFSRVQLFVTLWTVARQAPLSMDVCRQEYWSRLPCPPPGNIPNPGIKPTSPVSPALKVDFLLLSHQKCVEMLVAQLCPTLCNSLDCGSPAPVS